MEKEDHLKSAHRYNEAWDRFFLKNSNPSVEQILQHGRELMLKEGIRVNY